MPASHMEAAMPYWVLGVEIEGVQQVLKGCHHVRVCSSVSGYN